MSRTPLLSALRRTLRLSRLARARGESPLEALQRAREAPPALSRRTLLAAGLGAAAAACVHPPRPPAGSEEEVLVVGAGLAGLTAAWHLAQAGVAVRVVEAQGRLGGRVHSLHGRFPHAQVAELGGELIDTGHTTVQRLAAQLGLPLVDLAREPAHLTREVWHIRGERRTEAQVLEAFAPVARAIEAALAPLQGASLLGASAPPAAVALDRTSISAWLEGCGADAWLRELLEVAYTAEYGLEADEQSSLNLLTLISCEPGPFRLYGESDERYRIAGGNARLPQALAGALGEERLVLEERLVAVAPASDGRLRCTFQRGPALQERVARHVVLALPFTLLREVELRLPLPPLKAEAVRSLRYGANGKVMLGVDERVWRTRHASVGSSASSAHLTWETSRQQPGEAGILTWFAGGRLAHAMGEGSPEQSAARVAPALEALFPGLTRARTGQPVVRFHWPTHPWTRGSYASYGVGQRTRFGGWEATRVGNLHFAGEHCSPDAQGFMEGAALSGEAVAAEVLALLGRPAAAPATASAAAR